MNNLSIVGRIGKVGDLKYTPSGKAVVNFSVATDNGKDANGDKRAATWFEIALWDKPAESLVQYLKVGDRIGVEGKVRLQIDEGRDGKTYPKLVVDFARVELMGNKSEQTTAAPAARGANTQTRPTQGSAVHRPQPAARAAAPAQVEYPAQEITDEDIPF